MKFPDDALASTLLVLLLSVPLSSAADELKVRVTSYIASHDIKPVAGVEGRVAGSYLRRGMVFNENGEVGVFRSTGNLTMTKGRGIVESESVYTYEDGSTLALKVDGEVEARPGGGLIYRKLTGNVLGGTGRYEGIVGTGTATGRNLTPFTEETRSDAYFDVVVTYQVPRR
jgi:hypothetical protein